MRRLATFLVVLTLVVMIASLGPSNTYAAAQTGNWSTGPAATMRAIRITIPGGGIRSGSANSALRPSSWAVSALA